MTKWSLKKIKVKDLREHPRNPRFIKKDQMEKLKGLIERFGLIDKPVVNTDNMIIGGHQRLKALKEMKIKEVECWVPEEELDDRAIDELCIGLNRVSGEWDWESLANEWEVADLIEWGFHHEELLGKMEDEIEKVESSSSEEEEDKKKNLKSCPNCGHEF